MMTYQELDDQLRRLTKKEQEFRDHKRNAHHLREVDNRYWKRHILPYGERITGQGMEDNT